MLTLGGSEVPAVLGLDPYTSAYALGARKLGVTSDPPQSEAARHGLLLQEAHLRLVEQDGRQVMPAPAEGFTHPEHEWLTGHPDAFTVIEGERGPLELKLRGIAPSDGLRLRDTVQALVYVELTGAERGLVSTLHGGFGGIVRDEWTVERDAELWELIVERCERFLSLLADGRLPAPDGSDSARDAVRAVPGVNGEAVRADQATWQHVLSSRELAYLIDTAKAQKEAHDQAVQAFMGEATELVSPYDQPAARWRTVESHRLDTKALRLAHPALAAEFTKTTTSRRFEVNV